jgi:hypothetical protein
MRGLLAATAILLVAASRASAADLSASVDDWRQPRERQIVGELADFVRIPSVAANPEGLAAMAERLRTELTKRGFEARLIGSDTGAPPVVFGSLQTPGARRTVTFYAPVSYTQIRAHET